MSDSPTFEQLLAWVLGADESDEETFAEWLAKHPEAGKEERRDI